MKGDNAHFCIRWEDLGREPQVAPNPSYPNGVDVDVSLDGDTTCKIMLPYPAPRCGYYLVRCTICSYKAAFTTAGRPDDPRSATIPCRMRGRH